jgi:hypothetical protein
MKVYLNYPNPHMTLHGDSACAEIGKMQKVGQRDVTINRASFAQALNHLTSSGFQLGAQASVNDAWLTINFDDAEFEEAVAMHVRRLLGQRYSPLRNAQTQKHC